ncbi:1-(5-phosphoribosyl)-5 [Trichosporon asahii var. asahii CBS 8904]|uniref:1-(5-phosphoribosyl)-5 n=2 Tax=Trichosporon asahii var. asahii TaxID=189963 RepID=K1WT18_TRIAC|nr:1-(5-phosphoribosyl)-5 [Trichosporon asahii var. asahii CBS 2479]EJT46311.1 1-(5-phosphoribosyl)-5 [Trichosporon asahii var. asahii CBS 2479]EKD04089.1 1-(5-phosphoribosyl)-5 [Trichosporon asahii var. asahii CBS 8904]
MSRRHSQFRPCIDLHSGVVKQIVGGTLDLDSAAAGPKENFVAENPPKFYAELYRSNGLVGGHVIKLGPGNDAAAREALAAWPNGLQVGGGINAGNAQEWLDAGAEKVIVTSALFPGGKFAEEVLREMSQKVGKERLVVDISIKLIEQYCSELLIHAADVEGLCQGIDEELVKALASWVSIPCTYAGGAKELGDLALVDQLSNGKVDLTFGSALDIFGGKGVKFDDLVAEDKKAKDASQ